MYVYKLYILYLNFTSVILTIRETIENILNIRYKNLPIEFVWRIIMDGFFADTHSCINILARNKKTDTQICHQLLRLFNGFELP